MNGEKIDVADFTGHGGISITDPVIKWLFGTNVSILIDMVPEKYKIKYPIFFKA